MAGTKNAVGKTLGSALLGLAVRELPKVIQTYNADGQLTRNAATLLRALRRMEPTPGPEQPAADPAATLDQQLTAIETYLDGLPPEDSSNAEKWRADIARLRRKLPLVAAHEGEAQRRLVKQLDRQAAHLLSQVVAADADLPRRRRPFQRKNA